LKGDEKVEERPFSDISYERFLNEEKLMGSRCRECGSNFVPPRPLCQSCYSSEMEWVEMKGKGKLATFTCISIAPPLMIAQGYNREHPYCSGVVELEEGERVYARIEGVDATEPEIGWVGMPMRVKFLHREKETYLAFEPSPD
jgi:uncharacterized OB-fold protein